MIESRPVIDSGRLANLARVLARHGSMADLLPQLHEYAVEAAGGRCSVLLQANPRTMLLHPTSAFGLDYLPTTPWLTDPHEFQLATAALTADDPIPVPGVDARFGALASRLGTPHAILLPILGLDGPLGLVVIGLDIDPSSRDLEPALMPVADAFALAIERVRLRRDRELQRDLRALMHDFSRHVSTAMNLRAGLEIFCDGAARLFGADRVSVWLHHRRARELSLDASSDPGTARLAPRVGVDDAEHPAATSLRREHAQLFESSPGAEHGAPDVAVGLRGRQRALGTLIFEGMRIDPGAEADVLARAEEVARHLSAAIENTQLLEQVLQSRQELENTFNSLSDLVAVCDGDLRLVHANEAFAQRLGMPRHVMANRLMGDLVGGSIADWLAELVAAPTPGIGASAREIADATLGGTFAVAVTPLVGHEGNAGLVVIARDITSEVKLEAERVELRDRLTQSERLAALGQFVAGIAHEMNNPLQGVMGHLELLRTTGDLTPKLRRDLQMIYREAERAAKVVRHLLVFAGSRRISRRRLSLNAVASRVLALRAASHRAAGIEVIRDFDDALPRLVGDPLMLQEALSNVLLNAEHAVNGQSDARITVRTVHDAARGRAIISIADSGPGMTGDALTRVFEPFFTTKDVGKGTGLGLAIAYGVIQEHGGAIRAANGPARGAVFTIDLPIDSVK